MNPLSAGGPLWQATIQPGLNEASRAAGSGGGKWGNIIMGGVALTAVLGTFAYMGWDMLTRE